MNLLTIDIEEWFIWDNMGYLSSKRKREYDNQLNILLDFLESKGIEATFFCVGMMGVRFPNIVKKISARGHEIGCHSNIHSWLNKMTEKECAEDTLSAIDNLQQCTGEKVLSYRAPAFSLCEENQYFFSILAENGITRDSSVFPAKRDFGGFSTFGIDRPSIIRCGGINIKEFPIPITSTIIGNTAFSGGGYFRLFPYGFVSSRLKKRDYNLSYFHLADFLKERVFSKNEFEAYFKEKPGLFSTQIRSFKMNVGKRKSWKKFCRLVEEFDFISLREADKSIEWESVPVAIKI